MDYKHEYLAAFGAPVGNVFVLADEAGRLVGASTGLPLADDLGVSKCLLSIAARISPACSFSTSRCCCLPIAVEA